jgi:uncharacterized membrane protein (UPF0182 family)
MKSLEEIIIENNQKAIADIKALVKKEEQRVILLTIVVLSIVTCLIAL